MIVRPELQELAVLPDHRQVLDNTLRGWSSRADPVHNIATTYAVSGPFDLDAFRAAFHALVRRHEALRSVFQGSAEAPRHLILPEVEAAVDVRAAPAPGSARISREAWRLVREWAERPYDLARGPLVRACILETAPDERLAVLGFHHIVVDGRSLEVIFRDLWEFYRAQVEGEEPDLPALEVSYADWVHRAANALADDAFVRERAEFWRRSLAGVGLSPHVELTGALRRATQSGRAATATAWLDPAGLAAVEEARGEAGVSLFASVLAAAQTALAVRSEVERIPVLILSTWRRDPAEHELVGLLVTDTILVLPREPERPLAETARQTSRAVFEALEHLLPAPFVRELTGLDDAAPSTVFWFNLHDYRFVGEHEVARIRVRKPSLAELGTLERAKEQNLVLHAYAADEGLKLDFTYPEDVYEPARVEELAATCRDILLAPRAASAPPTG